MPQDIKDPERSQESIDSKFNDIVNNSLSDLKNSGPENNPNQSMNRHERRKSAKAESKQNKKNNINKEEQKARGADDPLNKEHQKDKNVGHIPGVGKLAKAAKQGKRGERMDATKTLAKRAIMKKLRKLAIARIKQAALSNPWVLGAIAVVVFIILLIIALGSNEELYADPNNPNQIPLTLSKTGPATASLGDELTYQINVGYAGKAEDITISDTLPEGTDYIDSTPPAKYDINTRTATWNLKDYQASPGAALDNVNQTLIIRLRSTIDNKTIVNQAVGNVIGAGYGGPIYGDIAALLPNPIPSDPDGVDDARNQALAAISQHKSIYEQVSSATGIPWQVFAGIHYREGGAAPNTSLVSGRPIGGNEPDVVDGPGCSSDAPQGVDDGQPEPFSGGCKFASMLDSGLYGGNLLKGKVGGEITSFEILIKALSRYNGGGNSNCGKGVPYAGCPRLFEGEDDPYALNFFDPKHKPMFVIYCADYTKCNPPVEDGGPGTATVAKWAAQSAQ